MMHGRDTQRGDVRGGDTGNGEAGHETRHKSSKGTLGSVMDGLMEAFFHDVGVLPLWVPGAEQDAIVGASHEPFHASLKNNPCREHVDF